VRRLAGRAFREGASSLRHSRVRHGAPPFGASAAGLGKAPLLALASPRHYFSTSSIRTPVRSLPTFFYLLPLPLLTFSLSPLSRLACTALVCLASVLVSALPPYLSPSHPPQRILVKHNG
jgi:hypothetical protein